jgi:hypothetical protein
LYEVTDETFLFWHKPYRLIKNSSGECFIHNQSGLEQTFKHGSYYDISVSPKIQISQDLLEFLIKQNFTPDEFFIANIFNNNELLKEFWNILINNRFATFLK